MMVAYDKPIGLATRAGLGLGYSWSTIDGKTYDANTDFNTYEATAYIGHERGHWFVHGDLSFDWNEYQSKRHIVFPGVDRTAEAEFSGQDYTAFVNTGYHFSAQKFTITPIVSLQYSHLNISDYTETGAGDINLNVESQDYNFLESGLGVKVEREFSYRGRSFIPEIHFKWLHELLNPKLEQTAAFAVAGSPSFTTPGLRTADNTYNAGIGCTLFARICRPITWSFEAVYDYDWRNDGYYANQGTLRVSGRF
jgi:outer membrane autotransporter protein